jgi:hypothetical protein
MAVSSTYWPVLSLVRLPAQPNVNPLTATMPVRAQSDANLDMLRGSFMTGVVWLFAG